MATGDQNDFVGRVRGLLPTHWFPDAAPVLSGVFAGAASLYATIWQNLSFVVAQTRIATATGEFLDIAAQDFFNGVVTRNSGEPDVAFSARIRREVLRQRNTRASVVQSLVDLTGRTPWIFEPANPLDAGGIGSLSMTVGTGLAIGGAGATANAGGWGSLALPFQFFAVGYRAQGGGIPNLVGYFYGVYQKWAGGGIFGLGAAKSSAGSIAVSSLTQTGGQITDAAIFAAFEKVRPIGVSAWVKISN